MRDLKNKLTPGKNSKNIQSRRGKSFGYQVLGFGSGGVAANYVIATGGTPCTGAISGDYKVHTFTGPGTLCVSQLADCAAENVVSYLVLAGGGGGGKTARGGGGGAGGFREYKNTCDPYTASPLNGNPGGTAITVSVSPYPITVGGGGTVSIPVPTAANKGSDSVFSTITSTGGGQGGVGGAAGQPGGSGGGGSIGGIAGGCGNDPPVTPAQGTPGGLGPPSSSPGSPTPTVGRSGQGGGGALVAGADWVACTPQPGTGGAGACTSITGCATAYGGGGGGGGCTGAGYYGGGAGGGGKGGRRSSPINAIAGDVNKGGGGGGNGPDPITTGSGGSGVVIVRYKFQ